MINKDQYKYYWENGYLIIKNLFTDKEIENIKNRLSIHSNKEWGNMLNPDRYNFLISHNPEIISSFSKMSEKINYLKECKKTSKLIRNLLKDERIVSRLKKLYNSEFIGLSTHMIWKKPGTKNAKQAWNPHQDNSYGQNKNAKILTINLFLDDVSIENGAIYNYPGSHKEGLLETIKSTF